MYAANWPVEEFDFTPITRAGLVGTLGFDDVVLETRASGDVVAAADPLLSRLHWLRDLRGPLGLALLLLLVVELAVAARRNQQILAAPATPPRRASGAGACRRASADRNSPARSPARCNAGSSARHGPRTELTRGGRTGAGKIRAVTALPHADDPPRETDPRFPSGRWRGYFEQSGRRTRMELDLTFSRGRLFGDGRDAIGDFVLSGVYDCASGACELLKTYLGQHAVEYSGRAARGIAGTWTLPDAAREPGVTTGPFHIWPIAAGEASADHAHAALALTR